MNPRPPGYEPDELPTALLRDMKFGTWCSVAFGEVLLKYSLIAHIEYHSCGDLSRKIFRGDATFFLDGSGYRNFGVEGAVWIGAAEGILAWRGRDAFVWDFLRCVQEQAMI